MNAHNKWYSVDMWSDNPNGYSIGEYSITNRKEFRTYEEAFDYFERMKKYWENIEILEWEKSCKSLLLKEM